MPVVTICPAPKFDVAAVRKLGFSRMIGYFTGKSKGNIALMWTRKSHEEVKNLLWTELFAVTNNMHSSKRRQEEEPHRSQATRLH